MRVEVVFFGPLVERAGEERGTLELSAGATVADALAAAELRWPQLAPLTGRVAAAIDEGYVRPERSLAEGEELALIPPVSGG